MEPSSLTGLIFLGVFVVIAAVLVRRSRRLREKEYGDWLASYRAAKDQPETDPNRLRELWMLDLRARHAGHRDDAAPSVGPGVDSNGVLIAPPMTPPRTNTFAVLSLVFSLGGGLLGIVFGHIALSQIKTSGEGGRNVAITGLVIGYGWIGLFLAFLALAYTISSLNGTL